MSRWFRFYDDVINDPKVIKLSEPMRWHWVALLCVASKHDGNLPGLDDVALHLRMKPARAVDILLQLERAGLLDKTEAGLRPHNWEARQYKSDVTDPTNATRQKRFRERHRNGSNEESNGVTAVTDKRPDTEADNRKKDIPPDGGSAPTKIYAFESGIVRLNARDFAQWREAFSYLDLPAELTGLAAWCEELGKDRWFHALKNALANRNREAKLKADALKAQGGFQWNGIEGVV